jgi:D-alanyl-lipoteichoic acid acyltransferase DltB (MBOAT superfamily)
MLFNSLSFLIFLPIIYGLYWFVFNKSLKYQNILLLVASYFFYCSWDWRFGFLLAFSTFLDYYTGIKIFNSNNSSLRKIWLTISVTINLGFLGFFKYYNFFIDSFASFIQNFGINSNYSTLNVILPVGISFYTFHGLSYVFDIYNRKIEPSNNPIQYSLFVSFFPLLVAGPIERATHLLPQVEKPRNFNDSQSVGGLKQILWGFFKKIVIADSCAQVANTIFNDSGSYDGSTLFVGALLFTFQIYGDFSGYSDIALGTARLFGFELLKNFNFPYFSRDIAEFWRRWHISLSTWFKDYLYIPLGGSKGGNWMRIRNTFIIFLVSGFWHGANWTFLIWGGLNALFILPSIIFKTNRNNIEIVAKGKILPSLKDFFNIFLTFNLTVLTWIFFRADSVQTAFLIISEIFSSSLFSFPKIFPIQIIALILFFMSIEWLGRENNYAIENLFKNKKRLVRWAFYIFLLFIMGMFMETSETEFIYFQF